MKRALLFIFIISFPAFSVSGQIISKKPIKQCGAQLACQLIDQQADFSRTLGETDRRVNVLIKVADFLWTGDADAARRYFAEAFQIAQERFREKGVEKSESKGLLLQKSDYRFTVISAIGKRDAEWAKKLTETVLKEFDEDKERDKRDSSDKDHEAQELLGIAAAAKDNPDLALSLARRVMRYPFVYSWFNQLFVMARNNQPLADRIYAELLNTYADAEVFRLLNLSAYPFGRDRIFGIEKYSFGTSVPPNFSPNPRPQRQFLTTLFRRVLRLTSENVKPSHITKMPESAVALFALNELEPIVSQEFPDLIPMFSQAKLQVSSIVSHENMKSADKQVEQGKNFDKSFAEKLKDIEKTDASGKLDDYQIFRLTASAKKEEEYKAAESWLDKMRDDAARGDTANYFYFQRSKLATEEKRFDDARRHANKVAKIENRAVLYFDIAEAKLKDTNTKYESLDTLLEVYQLAVKAPDSVEKAQVLMGLANVYEKISHSSALDSLSLAVKTANALENPNLFSSSQTQQITGKGFMFFASYVVPGFDVGEAFYEISRSDFQGALAAAESFNDKYLRTLAVIATVRDCEKNVSPVKPKSKAK